MSPLCWEKSVSDWRSFLLHPCPLKVFWHLLLWSLVPPLFWLLCWLLLFQVVRGCLPPVAVWRCTIALTILGQWAFHRGLWYTQPSPCTVTHRETHFSIKNVNVLDKQLRWPVMFKIHQLFNAIFWVLLLFCHISILLIPSLGLVTKKHSCVSRIQKLKHKKINKIKQQTLIHRLVHNYSRYIQPETSAPNLFKKILGFPRCFGGSSLFAFTALPLLQPVFVFRGRVHISCLQWCGHMLPKIPTQSENNTITVLARKLKLGERQNLWTMCVMGWVSREPLSL